MLTEQEVFKRFIKSINDAGGQRPWATAHGLTPSYVNDMVNKRRGLSERVLAMIGIAMEVVVTYSELTPEVTPDEKPKRGVKTDKPRSAAE